MKRFLTVVAVLAGVVAANRDWSLAQSTETGAWMVLRLQAGSIAEEVLTGIRRQANDSMSLRVSIAGGGNVMIVENAFLEALERSGMKISNVRAEDTKAPAVEVNVLEQTVQFTPLASSRFQRLVRTIVEARYRESADGNLGYVGPFQRTQIDTVDRREDLRAMAASPVGSDSETSSIFEKIAGPLIMIGSTFLIVYLFFTVRN